MAFLESAVVVYLRELYYPEGFSFPLITLSKKIIVTEMFRELATLIMIISIAFIATANKNERFLWFILVFGIWDIFYYVFLKLLIGWPESFLTWDVLFLIPSTWVGPVLGPVLNSVTMICIAVLILFTSAKGYNAKLNNFDWLLLIVGSVNVIIAYTEEYFRYMIKEFSLPDMFSFSTNELVISHASKFIPEQFNWLIYISGQILFFTFIYSYFRRKFCKK
jgi:hypothetical protein